ncbi:complex I NDUFA9 subunit family protein [Sphingomonas sp. HT-1]|uniref:complex I NDUFA9 subunit family protein n=1 Tax=unclassified Sphingomonas TaxID=196159 RepID=UPI0002DBA07F|nr:MULTISPECIES: complex I NDUFA9 subunit family protein [unclassified Sphingomonas]KTF67225.1 3-beta hydroxysteroid dehydrogenase [Sphingomonas sp. WG]
MKDRLVTLIGGGGFLGRYVAQELLSAGARVRLVERKPRDAWFLRTQGGLGQTQFVVGDVTKPETLARALQGSDAVVNFVGILSGDFDKVHVQGARNVAEAAKAAGASALVHISALGADTGSPSAYGRSKAAGEQSVLAAFPGATILRPSIVFGREDAFVNRFAGMIAGAPLGVVPVVRGETRFQPVFVADVAQAVAAALADPAAHGGKTYALGGPDVLSMTALMRWIAGAIGRKPHFIELPDSLSGLIASLPGTPITRDQFAMLQADNVVPAGAEGLAALGITPTPMATVAPTWLVRFRQAGRFSRFRTAA